MINEQYAQKYHIRGFTVFTSYFLANLFESKLDAQNHVIRLRESDFDWLHDEYKKFKSNCKILVIVCNRLIMIYYSNFS